MRKEITYTRRAKIHEKIDCMLVKMEANNETLVKNKRKWNDN